MRKSLLATVAAVALIAGTGMVAAENANEKAKEPAAKAGAEVKGHEMNKGADVKSGAQIKGKAETTGAGTETKPEMKSEPKAEMKSEPKANLKSENKTDSKTNLKSENKADTKSKAQTTGAGASDEKAGSATKSTEKSGTTEKSSATPEAKSSATTSSSTSAQTNAKAGGAVTLTTEQKTKIRTTVLQSGSAPKLSRSEINFNINVGTVVPRSVHFVTLPPTLVEIYPSWRGYDYFVVGEEIIIVDPHTLRIIAVLNV
jgi:hypothetical protein